MKNWKGIDPETFAKRVREDEAAEGEILFGNYGGNWANIHEDFVKNKEEGDNEALKTYQQKWEEAGLTYQDAQEWIPEGFKPQDYEEVNDRKDLGITPQQANLQESLNSKYLTLSEKGQVIIMKEDVNLERLLQIIQSTKSASKESNHSNNHLSKWTNLNFSKGKVKKLEDELNELKGKLGRLEEFDENSQELEAQIEQKQKELDDNKSELEKLQNNLAEKIEEIKTSQEELDKVEKTEHQPQILHQPLGIPGSSKNKQKTHSPKLGKNQSLKEQLEAKKVEVWSSAKVNVKSTPRKLTRGSFKSYLRQNARKNWFDDNKLKLFVEKNDNCSENLIILPDQSKWFYKADAIDEDQINRWSQQTYQEVDGHWCQCQRIGYFDGENYHVYCIDHICEEEGCKNKWEVKSERGENLCAKHNEQQKAQIVQREKTHWRGSYDK